MPSIPTYDVSTSNKGAEWDKFSAALYSYMEEHALSIISKMKSQHLSLFPSSGRAITGWLYYPKWKQLEMASYPKLAKEEDHVDQQGETYVPAWIVETNTQRCVLHAQLQQQLYSVLQTSFGDHEREIFSTYAIIHDMTAADDQQPRPMHEEDREKNFDLDNRWPNGTYAFLAIKRKYGAVKSVNIFTLMAEYELALKSFTGDNFETWRSQLKNKKFELDNAKRLHNPEFLEAMQVLMELWRKTSWKDWAQRDATVANPDERYYTVDAVLDRAAQQNDMKIVGEATQNIQAKVAQASAGAHYGNMKSPVQDNSSKNCSSCKKSFQPKLAWHRKCQPCQDKLVRSKNQEKGVGRLTELSTPAVAESITKKDPHNRRRDWAKKSSRKGAHANKAGKAEADSSNDDSSDDAEVASGHAARSIAVKEAMTASALTTQIISEALAKGKSKRKAAGKAEGCKVS